MVIGSLARLFQVGAVYSEQRINASFGRALFRRQNRPILAASATALWKILILLEASQDGLILQTLALKGRNALEITTRVISVTAGSGAHAL